MLATAETQLTAQRLLVALQGDAAAHRMALGTLLELGADAPLGELGVRPDGAPRRTALVDVAAGGDVPWREVRLGVHPTVVGRLLGGPRRDPDLHAEAYTVRTATGGRATLAVVTGADPGRRRLAAAEALAGNAFLVV